jgi:energy-coupling factor transport system substrate-specific component
MALICAGAGFAYGLVLNFSTWVTFTGQHTLAQFLVIEGEAFPFDLAHAVGNFVFFIAFGPALIRVLGRFRARMDITWGLATGSASALLLASLAVTALGDVGRIARAQAAAPALAAPVGYLERTQNSDGGFGLSPGQPSSQLASAWAVIGLAAAGRAPGSVRRDGHDAVTWIRAHLGQISDPGDTERTLLALAAARAPLGSLSERLAADQRRDGSVSGQANLTAFAILAWRAAEAGGATTRRAASWLLRQQNGDGGFSFAVRGDPSDIDDSAAALEALAGASSPAAPLGRARAYLQRQQDRDGGFPLQPGGSSNSQSTAWAVQALVATGAPVERALGYLRARTASSGAVQYAAGVGQTPVWVTAEALAALAQRPLPIG